MSVRNIKYQERTQREISCSRHLYMWHKVESRPHSIYVQFDISTTYQVGMNDPLQSNARWGVRLVFYTFDEIMLPYFKPFINEVGCQTTCIENEIKPTWHIILQTIHERCNVATILGNRQLSRPLLPTMCTIQLVSMDTITQ